MGCYGTWQGSHGFSREGLGSPQTWYWVLSMPTRKTSSARKRLMQRFLWMVVRSEGSPRRQQKAEMQTPRQTRATTMPTQEITDNSTSFNRPWYYKQKGV